MKKIILGSIALSALLVANEAMIKKGNAASDALLQKLGSNLTEQMQKNGPIAAVDFCAKEANKLTEAVSQEHGLSIKRVSDKTRNPDNQATKQEISIMDEYRADIAAKKELKPKLVNNTYYRPLLMAKDACIVCHGDIDSDSPLAKAIGSNYPADKATGYKMGELRALISVTMPQ